MTLLDRYINVRKKLFDKYYSRLNEKQREAVYAADGPLLVLAGAGSGKTTVLVQRIAHLIKYGRAMEIKDVPEKNLFEPYVAMLEKIADEENPDKGQLENALNTFAVDKASPYEILSITFTNKAAKEMKERLEKSLGDDALNIWAGTFHSICARLLRMHIEVMGRERDFTIYDTDDQKKLMTECIKELNANDKMFPPKLVLSEVSRAKEKLIDWKGYMADVREGDVRHSTMAQLYKLYEDKKRAANAVDFDDIICLTVELFKTNPDILEKYRNRFKYILVDEYQDTNKAQFELTRLLCNDNYNIMVVGDDDQSIYKFRGATIENILSFDRNFKNTRIVKLEQNYRSTDMIIGAANAVIKNNAGRKGKTLWTEVVGGEKITVKKCETQNSEAQYIVDKIGELVKDGKYNFGDFAILYRMNAQS
ncbi:MAG: UvrD-helicase domain-containing protein, partial [Clostridia bacterium]|nr:UvrD-helicase domain-containing protein [Clostridia bacterium]